MKTGYLKHQMVKAASILSMLILFTQCTSFNSGVEDEEEITDRGEPLVEQAISDKGGSVEISDQQSQLYGFKIEVPPNSYANTTNFKVYGLEITSHNFDENFHPISPLIQVENGGEYASNIMEVTIPIDLPVGHFPIGFYYNDTDGTLEAIPIKGYTQNTVTLQTRHFKPSSELAGVSLKSKKADLSICNMVVSSISESVINAQPVISSGYKIGVDNWEFVNYGSYVAPGGHCAGQTWSSMWYYYEKKLKGEPALNNRFSTIPNFDEDNAIGYRFCSRIQEDLEFGDKNIIDSLYWVYINTNQAIDVLKFYTIAAAMLITGEPQAIGIWKEDGKWDDGTKKYAGHALICYKISPSDGKLFICDPNEPTIEESIYLKGDRFEPYLAKANANEPQHSYPFINYYAKTAYIEWDKIGKRYKEMQDSTIGNDIFPAYSIVAHDKKNTVVNKSYVSDSDTFKCSIVSPSAKVWYLNANKEKCVGVSIHNQDGEKISTRINNTDYQVALKPGVNKLGFYIYGWRESSKTTKGGYYDQYIDFKWVTIHNSGLKISPNPISATVNQEVAISVETTENESTDKYVWDFGDGTTKTVDRNTVVTHIFEKPGSFTVTVQKINSATNSILATATAQATVAEGENLLNLLSNFKYIKIQLSKVEYASNAEFLSWSGLLQSNYMYDVSTSDLSWNGNNFTVEYEHRFKDWTKGEYCTRKGNISGALSSDGKNILTLNAYQIDTWDNLLEVYKTNFTFVNVGFENKLIDNKFNLLAIRYKVDIGVNNHVTKNEINWDGTYWDETNMVDVPFNYYVTSSKYNTNSELVVSFSNTGE